jgi:hypothetical protein
MHWVKRQASQNCMVALRLIQLESVSFHAT